MDFKTTNGEHGSCLRLNFPCIHSDLLGESGKPVGAVPSLVIAIDTP